MKTYLKKTAPILLVSTLALFATNGDTLIGVGVKTRGMGGAGIAFSHGAESTLVNPSLITDIKQKDVSLGGTIFRPNIKTTLSSQTPNGKVADSLRSKSGISMIPTISAVSPITDNIFIGVGMYGTAGMGTDFRNGGESSLMQGNRKLFDSETTLNLLQFSIPVAIKEDKLSVGIAPIIQYGSLDIHYSMFDKDGKPGIVSPGQKQDFGLGANIGVNYKFDNGLSLGAIYKSKIKMDYKDSLKVPAKPFGIKLNGTLTQPSEYGIGLGYKKSKHGIAVDFKRINWGDASGYREFGWKNQNIFAIGYEYDNKNWALRAGYNYGSLPITIYNSNNQIEASKDMFNLLGFPATTKSHITLGGSYIFAKDFSMDFSFVYGLNQKSIADIGSAFGAPSEAIKILNEHSESSLSTQINYRF